MDSVDPDADSFAFPAFFDMGQEATSGGIGITVNKVSTADTIQLNTESVATNSSYAKFEDMPAGAGAKYVIVETTVNNKGKTSIDLTCSAPVIAALNDEDDRNFDPIQELYKLKGNPECNDNLQPGFSSPMTWIHKVPADAKIVAWTFEDITDFAGEPRPKARVRLTVS